MSLSGLVNRNRLQSTDHASKEKEDRKQEEQQKELCYIELEGEDRFSNYALYCFPFIGFIARKKIELAKLAFNLRDYDRCLHHTKKACLWSSLSFIIGILIYFTIIVSFLIYKFPAKI